MYFYAKSIVQYPKVEAHIFHRYPTAKERDDSGFIPVKACNWLILRANKIRNANPKNAREGDTIFNGYTYACFGTGWE